MGGLLDALSIGRSAIEAARVGVQVTGHNIANASTEGYHRQRVLTSAVAPPISQGYLPGGGMGVQVDGVYRTFDSLMAQRVLGASGEDAWASARQAAMMQLEQATASIGDGGLGAAIDDLMRSFSALSATPSDETTRAQVIEQSQRLATTLNRMADALTRQVDGVHQQATSLVNTINSKSAQIAQLNTEIVQAEAGAQEASDLRDQRDLLVRDLAELAGVSAFENSSGHMTVLLNGQALVQDDRVATLQATQGTDGRTAITLGSRAVTVTFMGETGGELGGLLSVQQTAVLEIQVRLDQLAYDLGRAINAQHQAGYDLNGVAGGAIFVLPATAPGTAAAISVSSTLTPDQVAASSSATGGAGNNENALALAGLADQDLAAGASATFTEEAAAMTGHIGTLTDTAIRAAAVRSDELSYLKTLQQSSDGVSLDEEMIQLVQYQRSYQAGVRLLQVVDQLMEQLLRM